MRVTRFIFLALLVVGIWGAVTVRAQGLIAGRSTALANAYTTIARGIDAPSWNPANLALKGNPRFELGLVGVGIHVSNSTFSKHFYDLYNGKYLDDSDKQDILSRIPDSGLRLVADTHLQALGFALHNFALTFSVVSDARFAFNKEYMSLVLNGLDFGKRYNLSGNQGEVLGYGNITLSVAHAFPAPFVQKVAVGANFRYLVGVGTARIDKMQAEFVNTYKGYANGELLATYGLLGRGMALDLGAATQYAGWTAGVAFSNLLGSIKWVGQRGSYFASFRTLVALNAYALSQVDGDSVAHVDTSTTEIPAFSTRLPAEMRIGVSRKLGSFLISGDYHQGFSRRPGVSPRPFLALASEWQGVGFLPLRAGVSLGGPYGFSSAFGFGLYLGPLKWDLGVLFPGALWPSFAKGIQLGTNLNLRF